MEPRFTSYRDSTYPSLEEIIAHIDKYPIAAISFNSLIGLGEYTITNEEKPITYTTKNNRLVINIDYYVKHKEYIDNILSIIISRLTTNSLQITSDGALTNSSIINAILSNKNLSEITINGINKQTVLTNEMYLAIKNSKHITSVSTDELDEELKENFDSILYASSRMLIGFNTYQDLISKEKIRIDEKDLNPDNTRYLKHINADATIEISGDNFPYELFFDEYNKLGKENKIIIKLNNKTKFNNYIFNNPDLLTNQNIQINFDFELYDLNVYKEYEQRLFKMIEPALSLSPFERYLFAYNIVKQYKPYNENEGIKEDSRRIYRILDNDYMVCVGYASMLIDLLDRLGIKANEKRASVNIGMDYNENEDIVAKDNSTKWEGHARVEVQLDDDKYGIHGVYLADPTWDNVMNHDSYNYCLLTRDEYNQMDRQNKFIFHEELFDATSLEEFFYKVNFVMDRYKIFSEELDTIDVLTDFLKKYNMALYDQLVNKYPVIKNHAINIFIPPTADEISDIITTIGNYIVSINNNKVDANTIFKAAIEVYKANGLSAEEIQSKLADTIEFNQKHQKKSFPNRMRVDQNGEESYYVGDEDKFNVELNTLIGEQHRL